MSQVVFCLLHKVLRAFLAAEKVLDKVDDCLDDLVHVEMVLDLNKETS